MLVLIITLIVGAALGVGYRVLILLPVSLIAVATITTVGMLYSSASGRLIAASVFAVCGLQIGYLIGGVFLRAIFLSFKGGPITVPSRELS
jgi:hypothetical protein